MSVCFCIGPLAGRERCPCQERADARRFDGLHKRVLRAFDRQRRQSSPTLTAELAPQAERIGEGCYLTPERRFT